MRGIIRNKRIRFLLFILLITISGINLQQSNAQITNIWGIIPGASRTYQIQREINGSISGILDDYLLQYKIIDVFDNDGDNFTDIKIGIIDLSADSTGLDIKVLSARAWWYFTLDWVRVDDDNIYFYGFSDKTLINCILNPNPPLVTTYIVLPTSYNNDSYFVGVNWTYAMNKINSSIADYTAYDLGDTLAIRCNRTNEFDAYYKSYYDEIGIITWNRSAGWLETIEYKRTYNEPLNFTIETTVRPFSSKVQPSGVQGFEIGKVFSIIGFCIGILDLGIAIILINKKRKMQERGIAQY